MKKPDFIICAALHNSLVPNNTLSLIQLAKALEKLGRNAYLCQILGHNDELILTQDLNHFVPQSEGDKQIVDSILQTARHFGVKLFSEFTHARINECYVVYPECVLNNPLDATHVIRYFLNKDGAVKPHTAVDVGPHDFTLAHTRAMYPAARQVCHFAYLDPVFNRVHALPTLRRKMDLSYIGKGAIYGVTEHVPHTVNMTRTWPETKEQLAILLRSCRFFYTADACSQLNNEALSCGAIPVLVHNGPWSDAEIDSFEAGALPRMRPGTPLDAAFFAEFDIARERYLRGLNRCVQGWEPSVRHMVEMVDRHFAAA